MNAEWTNLLLLLWRKGDHIEIIEITNYNRSSSSSPGYTFIDSTIQPVARIQKGSSKKIMSEFPV